MQPSFLSRSLRSAGLSVLTATLLTTGLVAPAMALPGYQLRGNELMIAADPGAKPVIKVRVAILDFKAIGAPKQFGEAVAENLRNALVEGKQFTVVERSQIDKAIKEQAFGQSGLVDAKQAVTLGKLVGAKIIVVGSVTKIGSTYSVNARFIDVQTGEATEARSLKTQHEDDIAAVVDEIATALGGTSGASSNASTWGSTAGTGSNASTWGAEPAGRPQSSDSKMIPTGKSKLLASTMSFLIPGAGQFYAGNAGAGALQLAFGLAGAGVAGYGRYDDNSAVLGGGLLLLIIASTWSALDGWYGTQEEKPAN
jgi:TolB-like protein